MLLADIAQTSQEITATRSRLAKVAALQACMARLAPEELRIGCALLSGELPDGRIGVGYAQVRALAEVPAAPAASLTLASLAAAFVSIGEISGKGSAAERLRQLNALFSAATSSEQDFLRRLLIGELRQGAQESILADAVAKVANLPAAEVRRALMLSGQLGEVAEAAFARGAAGLAEFRIQLFRPLQPMLAQTAADPSEAITALGATDLEFKLDGARIQVHRSGNAVRVFTRQLNDVTEAVPEVVERALALPVSSIILDGEVIALDQDHRPQPFQVTMRRFGRKLDVAALRQTLPLEAFFFDCLHLNGEDLIGVPLSERLAILDRVLAESPRVERLVTADAEAADAFFDRALAAGHEGLVAKALDSTYEAGRRGGSWLKIKPVASLDLVVLAAEWGSGRRQGWLSNLHLGARDPDGCDNNNGGFVMLGKTFKGMTDEVLAWQTEKLLALETSRDAYTVHVRPELVAEVLFDGVQDSTQYPGGVALRFARLRRYRPDKSAAEADTIAAVRAIGHHAR